MNTTRLNPFQHGCCDEIRIAFAFHEFELIIFLVAVQLEATLRISFLAD